MFNPLKTKTMKKVLLSVGALLFSLGLSAQGWTTTGAHDDFAASTFYKNGSNLEGVVWWSGPDYVLTRNGDGKMIATGTNAGGSDNGLTSGTGRYPLIGVNFNDSNDNGTGTSFTVDLSAGANVQVDVENTHASKMVYMVVILGAWFNIALFALLVMMILFNAMVIHRLFVWREEE